MKQVLLIALFLSIKAMALESGNESGIGFVSEEITAKREIIARANCPKGKISYVNNKIIMTGYVCDQNNGPVADAYVLVHMGGPVNMWQDIFGFTDDNGRYYLDLTGRGFPMLGVSWANDCRNFYDAGDLRGTAIINFKFPAAPDEVLGIKMNCLLN